MTALMLPTFFNGGGLMLAWLIVGFTAWYGMRRMVNRP